MSNQLQITGGAKVRNLEGVLTGTSGVVSSLGINVPSGIPQLDGSGKILVSQLPNSVMEYKGTWDASTNTPTLVDGTGNAGDVYLCNVAGTVNFGSGPITFYVGDQVLYSGTIWQRASGASGTVTSVAVTESGDALTITGSPITTSGTINIGFAGTGSQYIKGDGTLATFPTTIDQAKRLITEVYNSTGATLSKGTIVYINGGQGNLPTVTKAIATGDATSAQTYGVVQSDITDMNNGYVVVLGSLTDLDTQAYAVGTQLYLSGTTAGAWTSTKPYAPIHLVYVGIVVRSHPTQGVVEIRIQNGYELDELHDVSAQNPNNGDILQYVAATDLWTKTAGTTTNIAEGTNLYFTNTRAQDAITLTTTGTSGAATYSGGTLNIPQYQGVLTNPVTGTGTTNTLPKFTGTSAIGNSNITDTGSLITLGSNTTISSGGLGIGTSSLTGISLRIGKTITGATTSYGVLQQGIVQSDVTTTAFGYYNEIGTQAAAFTLTNYRHFFATASTIGAGSTVTNQVGFFASATLTGGTNNYGFQGSIPAAANRWNLYMDGTANNYMAGALGIGSTALTGINLNVNKNNTGATTTYNIISQGNILSDVTASAHYFTSSATLQNAVFTLTNLYHYRATGASSFGSATVTNQYGFIADSVLTGATNNYGFYGNIAAATGRWNLFMNGTADNYLAGSLGIGSVQVNGGPILTITLTSGGSGYVDGTYTDVAMTGGGGQGALATFVVSGGIVTTATLTWGGANYIVGGALSASNANLGGTGSGLSITVATVDSSQFSIGSTTGGDITLFRNDTTLVIGDNLGTIKWMSNDTTVKGNGLFAEIGAFAASTAGGGYLSFFTRDAGAATLLKESVRIDSRGGVGIGATTLTGYSLRVSKNITGATTAYAIRQDGSVQSDVTVSASNFASFTNTAAASFTLGSYTHFSAQQGTIGAGSSITTQYGFLVTSNLTGATNNYAFFGNIPAQANAWNIYMAGTANNYMAGKLNIGTTSIDTAVQLHLLNSTNGYVGLRLEGSGTYAGTDWTLFASSSPSSSSNDFIGFYNNSTTDSATVGYKVIITKFGTLSLGTVTPDASAKVQVDSTTQGFLPPRMTSAQRSAIATPATGLMVYQTDGTEGVYVYTSAGWKSLTMV